MDCNEFRSLIQTSLARKMRGRKATEFWQHRDECRACLRDFQRAEVVWRDARERALPPSQWMQELGEREPVASIGYTIIQHAILDGASEVHLEPSEDELAVRYRINNELRKVMPLPGYLAIPLVGRFKKMAYLNLLQWDAPQQGFIRIRYENKDYRLDIFTTPGEICETVVARFVQP